MEVSNYWKVYEFHKAFEQPTPSIEEPTNFDDKLGQFRLDLIYEEYNELKHAINTNNFVEIRDALADILYVVYGTAVSYGIQVDPLFFEKYSEPKYLGLNLSNFQILYEKI